MKLTLYLVHGSHPCVAVEKALEMKGLTYRVVELPVVIHAGVMRLWFGNRTVPGLRIDGEKISGSRVIMRRLDALVATPALYPADPDRRASVESAERWGDEVFQQIGRDLIWPGIVRHPEAAVSYGAHARVPLPAPVTRTLAPVIARGACRLNRASPAKAAERMRELPAHFDRIDAWITDGTIGQADQPNAADLQILSTVRLMRTFADVRPLLAGRPLDTAARALFPMVDGELPAGAIPA